LEIYNLTKNFPREEIYGITSQIRRSSVSIPANIAEGCAKSSNADFARFLQISLGSTHETDYLLLLSMELNYIDIETYKPIYNQINEVKAMLLALHKKVKPAEKNTLNSKPSTLN